MVPPMARSTIDFGIDLGTTNSEIAFVDKGQVHVIRNGFRDEITPSAVRIDRKGSIIVGKLAFNQRVDDKENTHTQFKRLMGSQQVLSFPSSGRQMKPEELSAEVLKSLRQDVLRETGEEITASVITIPALFEIPQCDATRRAAEIGRDHLLSSSCRSLLRRRSLMAFRPKAWTGSYSYTTWAEEHSMHRSFGRWKARLRVIDHAGDNFLGGKDFDDRLLDYCIRKLQREVGLRELDPSTDRKAFAKLLAEAENAKIQLSNSPSAYISITDLGKGTGGL